MFSAFELLLFLSLVACMASCLACGLLAARKGYNIYLWAAAGGLLVSFVVLACLPFVNNPSQERSKQNEKTGNWVGAGLAAVSLLGLVLLLLQFVVRTRPPRRITPGPLQMLMPQTAVAPDQQGKIEKLLKSHVQPTPKSTDVHR